MAPHARDDINALVNAYRQDKDGGGDSDGEEDWQVNKPFVDRTWFNLLVGLVITANAITIGLETDARSGGAAQTELSPVWFYLEVAFCFVFMVELGLRLFFYGSQYFAYPIPRPLADGLGGEAPPAPRCQPQTLHRRAKYGNIMDFFIVSTSLLDTFILTPLGNGGGARFVSMLRFVRLLRLIRLVRLFKIFKELWLVANGLINAMKTLLWVCVMIFIVCYIFGICATMWVGHNDKVYDAYFEATGWDHEVYFATVLSSVFTLFQVITLDQWSDSIARHVIKNQPGMIVFFIMLICIVTFGLLNIIVGVVVENALSTAAKDQNKVKKAKEADRQLVFSQLREIFEDADADGSGTLSFEEVEEAITKPEIYNKLRMIEFPVDNPKQIFELLDYDDSGELTIDEFITGCLRMKGPAKSKDLLFAQVALDCMKRHYNAFEKELAELQGKLNRLDATARAITDHGERVFLDMQQYRLRHPHEKRSSFSRMNTGLEMAPWEADADQDEPAAEAHDALVVVDSGDQLRLTAANTEAVLSIAAGLGEERAALGNGSPSPPQSHALPALPNHAGAAAIEDLPGRAGGATRPVEDRLAVPGSLPG